MNRHFNKIVNPFWALFLALSPLAHAQHGNRAAGADAVLPAAPTANACNGKDPIYSQLIGQANPPGGLIKVAKEANDKLQEHLKDQEHYYNELAAALKIRNAQLAYRTYDHDKYQAVTTASSGAFYAISGGAGMLAPGGQVSGGASVVAGTINVAQGIEAYQFANKTLIENLEKLGALSAEEADSAKAENKEKALFAVEHIKAHSGEQQSRIFDYAQLMRDPSLSDADRKQLLANKRIEINSGVMLMFGEPVTSLSESAIADGNRAPKPVLPAMEQKALADDPTADSWPGPFADNYTDTSGWAKLHAHAWGLAKDGAQYQVDNVEYTSEEARWQQIFNQALDQLNGTRSEQGMHEAIFTQGKGTVQDSLQNGTKAQKDVADAMVNFYTSYLQKKLKYNVEMSTVEYAKLMNAVDTIQRLNELCKSPTFRSP